MLRSAEISSDGRRRWFLQRSWGDGPVVLWIGLNPSKADAERDDATIRKMVGFTDRWGYRQMSVCNLFVERATQQRDLFKGEPAIADPRNLALLADLAGSAAVIVACWGAPPQVRAWADRRAAATQLVMDLLAVREDQDVHCLGRTRGGFPRHPCRLAYTTPLELFEPRWSDVPV